ncbi:MAG: hypothetical protein TREMPRED_001976 [Tremellales sp. Tagirdzhanova-0007]|nr:MAG: hypothetical protein TREMPRED_001976 [Tremellales sp. Tagirdzhanova-0007]
MSQSPESLTGDGPERRLSVGSTHSRPDLDEAPAKRMRTDAKVEDKARSKRLFGNLLGTLQKFKNEDKSSRTSEAVRRREQVSERIATKLRSEATLHHQIAESEKELKSLRITTESADFVLKHKDAAMIARHASIRPTSKFMHTALPPIAPPIFETSLLDPSPIPLNQGPSREPPNPNQIKPLYFLPKVLLPEQEITLTTQIASIEALVTEESDALAREKESVAEMLTTNRARIDELVTKLERLRKQVKPMEKVEKEDFGRAPKEEMEVDRDGDKEAGVQIKGEDGDVEVEY